MPEQKAKHPAFKRRIARRQRAADRNSATTSLVAGSISTMRPLTIMYL
jgi:hypothetical protein